MAVIKNFDEIVERVKGFPEPMRVTLQQLRTSIHYRQSNMHRKKELQNLFWLEIKQRLNKNLCRDRVWVVSRKEDIL